MSPSPFKVKFGFILPLEKSFKLKKSAIVVNLLLSGIYSPKGTKCILSYWYIIFPFEFKKTTELNNLLVSTLNNPTTKIAFWSVNIPVSYTHLTLPTILLV